MQTGQGGCGGVYLLCLLAMCTPGQLVCQVGRVGRAQICHRTPRAHHWGGSQQRGYQPLGVPRGKNRDEVQLGMLGCEIGLERLRIGPAIQPFGGPMIITQTTVG